MAGLTDQIQNAKNPWDMAYVLTKYFYENGSTAVPVDVINQFGGNPIGNGTYRLVAQGTNSFGFELFGEFTTKAEKYSEAGTIEPSKGGYRVFENGAIAAYADFDRNREGHDIFHFHPYGGNERWDFPSDIEKIQGHLWGRCSSSFKEEFGTDGMKI